MQKYLRYLYFLKHRSIKSVFDSSINYINNILGDLRWRSYRSHWRSKLGRFEYIFNTIFVTFSGQDFHGAWFWWDRVTQFDPQSLLRRIIYMIKKWPNQNKLIGYNKKYWDRLQKRGARFAFAKIISKRPQLKSFFLIE